MRINNKIYIVLFVVGFLLTIAGSIPMIFDRDDAFLLPSYIAGAFICLFAIMGLRRNFRRTRK